MYISHNRSAWDGVYGIRGSGPAKFHHLMPNFDRNRIEAHSESHCSGGVVSLFSRLSQPDAKSNPNQTKQLLLTNYGQLQTMA